MTRVLADSLLPIFAALLLGYLAGLWGKVDNKNVRSLITFVMSFAVPSSMFLAIAGTPRGALRQQAAAAVVLIIVYVILYAIGFLWVHSRQNLRPSNSSVFALTLGFPNSAAIGLALLPSVFGPQATVTVATSVAVGAITISPVTLAFLETSRRGSDNRFALSNFAPPLLHSVKKPIVWAPLLGLVFSCLDVNLPSFLHRSVAVMGLAADGSALILTGLMVSAQTFEFTGSTIIAALLKNVLQPALALGCAMLMHLPIERLRDVVLISALPCGFFGIVFGKEFDSTPKLASSALIVSYVLGIATLVAWIVILKGP